MYVAVYVVYELLVRLQGLDPEIGDYVSFSQTRGSVTIRTTRTKITVVEELLERQFADPSGISDSELLDMLERVGKQ